MALAILSRLQLGKATHRSRQNHFLFTLCRNLYNQKKEAALEIETLRGNADKSSLNLTFAERCKNVLTANWQGILSTVKAAATGSKEELHSSSVHYIFRNEKPIIWIDEDDLHIVNTVLDERGSLCINQTNPPPLTSFLKSVGKIPPRIVLVGDVIRLEDDKIDFAMKELNDMIISEKDMVDRASYPVSGILSSSGGILNARVKDLEILLDKIDTSAAFEFDIRSCSYLNILGNKHEINIEDIKRAAVDPLSPFFGPLIEGINRSETRRRGLMLFCSVYLNVNAKDALMLSVDRKGFDILGKVSSGLNKDPSSNKYEWKDLSFSFGREVEDIETFCRLLAMMEEEALKRVSGIII